MTFAWTIARGIAFAMRKRLPGYSISLERKKQYELSRLQTAPVGLASR